MKKEVLKNDIIVIGGGPIDDLAEMQGPHPNISKLPYITAKKEQPSRSVHPTESVGRTTPQ